MAESSGKAVFTVTTVDGEDITGEAARFLFFGHGFQLVDTGVAPDNPE